jgi:glycosyltransferase involved in cell wall biosynthesis
MDKKKYPLISVILPVYNGAKYLKDSIESILNQDCSDFELIVINDGSSDNSEEIISSFNDPRIKYYFQKNLGLARTLNRGIAEASGKYIARHDQDDISYKNRFSVQVNFLNKHRHVAVVGSWANIKIFDLNTSRYIKHPVDDAALKVLFLFDNYFVHSSVMIRKKSLEAVNGYSDDINRQPPEDYELWSRMMRSCSFANIPNFLICYREIPTSMSRTLASPILSNVIKISIENLNWAIQDTSCQPEIDKLALLMHGNYKIITRPNFIVLARVLGKAVFGVLSITKSTALKNISIIFSLYFKLFCRWLDYYCQGRLERTFIKLKFFLNYIRNRFTE